MFAEQVAGVPPLLPVHVQPQGPEPVIVDAVPVVQKLTVGVLVNVPPLLLPQAPFEGTSTKDAVTLFAASMVTVQAPVPLHAPVQPVKVLPPAGVAERVTDVLKVMEAEQVDPQLMPPGEEVTVPLPLPDLATESVEETMVTVRTGQT